MLSQLMLTIALHVVCIVLVQLAPFYYFYVVHFKRVGQPIVFMPILVDVKTGAKVMHGDYHPWIASGCALAMTRPLIPHNPRKSA
jgi:hypothetical protein